MQIIKKSTAPETGVSNPNEGSIVSLRDAMNRLFDESFWSPFSLIDFPRISHTAGFPKIDISETDQDFIIEANVPEVDPDKLNIEVTEDSVSISGSIERKVEDKNKNWHRVEREYGQFHREFSLPSPIDPDSVKADGKNGVVTITLKKKADAGRKKVAVTVRS